MKYFIYNKEARLEEAIAVMDKNGNGFLPVVDEFGKLYGVITDGDLRRGILNRNLDLDSIINKNPLVEFEGASELQIKLKLKKLHRRHMPVVDLNYRLVKVVVVEDFEYQAKENVVVIMAGGIGSRLGELTKNTPKPMLPVGGKPILEGIIDCFKFQGYGKFILCVNYKAELIEEYFGDGTKFDVKIKYTKEKKRLGTAGALSLIQEQINAPFFVVNGDVLTSISYENFMTAHLENNASATMCVKRFSNDIPYACVEFNERLDLVSLKEKPSFDYYINTGMYILNPLVLKLIPKETYFDMPMLFELIMSKKEPTKVHLFDEYWLDIGRPKDYEKGITDSFL